MTCTSPFRMKNPKGVLELPCGHCLACKIAKSREWASRIIHEMVYYDQSVFCTFTYSTENLPNDKSLDVAVLQKLLKRIRKASGEKIRYFARVNMVMVMVLGQLTRIITRYYLVLVGRKTTVNYLKKHGGTLKPVRRMGFYTLARLLSIQPVM